MMRKGFTLVEIMIVVAIIALLAAIAIPNLLRARISAQEAAAAAAMHTLVAAEVQFRAVNPNYSDLNGLGTATPPYIDSSLGCSSDPCEKSGFNFTAAVQNESSFFCTAEPKALESARTYYVDEDGVVCRSNTTNTTARTSKYTGTGCGTGYDELK